MTPLRREVERLLAVGRRCGMPKTAGTCRDILKRREALWTFVQVEGVEPTNNAAERSIRPGVLWRKGSFGTQSAAGSRFVESMMTVVTTLKQQQRNVLEYLTAACEAALRGKRHRLYAPQALSRRTLWRNSRFHYLYGYVRGRKGHDQFHFYLSTDNVWGRILYKLFGK
jgi:transposase